MFYELIEGECGILAGRLLATDRELSHSNDKNFVNLCLSRGTFSLGAFLGVTLEVISANKLLAASTF